MKICEYGCEQEGKYYFKTVDKWCCSENHAQCLEVRKKIGRKLKNSNPWNKGKNDCYSEKTINQMKNSHKLTTEQIKERYSFFLEIEELRFNIDKKEVQVRCKYNECKNSKEKGGWFTPTYSQLYERSRALAKPKGFGESNFYCSQKCKDICSLYRSRSDPFKNTEFPFTPTERQIWRQIVLIREEYICEFCEGLATTAHHILPVKTHPHLALDPDNGVACCEECHYKYGHKTGTECSTGKLANKIQPDCTLGGQK